jgi:hypothetical protein
MRGCLRIWSCKLVSPTKYMYFFEESFALRFCTMLKFAAISLLARGVFGESPLASGPWGDRMPQSPPEAVVISGRARFTVLTDRLLRMEYSSADGAAFEDRATMFAINRDLGVVPSFTQGVDSEGVLTITTSALKLTFKEGGEGFTEDSLSVVSVDSASAFEDWHFGKADRGNLLGTIRTLDAERLPPLNCTVLNKNTNNQCGWDASDCACEWAPISKDGWALIDDSKVLWGSGRGSSFAQF